MLWLFIIICAFNARGICCSDVVPSVNEEVHPISQFLNKPLPTCTRQKYKGALTVYYALLKTLLE